MGCAVDCKKCFFWHLSSTPFPLNSLLHPVSFKDTEDNNIKALVDVRGVGWVAEDMDLVCPGVVKEFEGIVGVVAINNKEASLMYVSQNG